MTLHEWRTDMEGRGFHLWRFSRSEMEALRSEHGDFLPEAMRSARGLGKPEALRELEATVRSFASMAQDLADDARREVLYLNNALIARHRALSCAGTVDCACDMCELDARRPLREG